MTASKPQEYLSITSEELLIVEHGCIYPDKDECIGKHCKYHDPNPSFRDNVVCLLNEHDVADRVRSRPNSSQPAPERPLTYTVGECMEQCQLARKAEREQVLEQLNELRRYSSDEYQESDLSDNEREMRIHVEYGNRIWGIMKSLRQQEGKP